MFPMTVTIHTPAQLNAVLSAMRPELQASDFAHPAVGAAYEEAAAKVFANEAAKDTASPKPKAEKTATGAATGASAPSPRTAEAGPSTPGPTAAAPAPSTEATPPAAAAPSAEPITYEKVAAAITAMVKTDRQRAVDALAKFNAKKGPDLKPEQYGDFLAALG